MARGDRWPWPPRRWQQLSFVIPGVLLPEFALDPQASKASANRSSAGSLFPSDPIPGCLLAAQVTGSVSGHPQPIDVVHGEMTRHRNRCPGSVLGTNHLPLGSASSAICDFGKRNGRLPVPPSEHNAAHALLLVKLRVGRELVVHLTVPRCRCSEPLLKPPQPIPKLRTRLVA